MRNRRGLSLVEIFVGMAVAIIASVVALQFLIYCERIALQPRLRLIAANFAKETIESLYQKSFNDLPSTIDTGTDSETDTETSVDATPDINIEPYTSNPDLKLLFERYHGTRSYTVEEKSGTDNVHAYKVVKVKVDWSWS